jgi:hypothetical protein
VDRPIISSKIIENIRDHVNSQRKFQVHISFHVLPRFNQTLATVMTMSKIHDTACPLRNRLKRTDVIEGPSARLLIWKIENFLGFILTVQNADRSPALVPGRETNS